jgi:mediator of RNA polymerase II transcription subunit 14
MAQEGVALRALATQAAGHGFQQLAALTQSLPGRPEDERRRELLRTLHSLRQMLLRLLVLARWSPRADPAMQFLKIREVLSARDATFHDVATRLVAVHHTVASEPIHDVPAALRVLSAGVLGNAEHLLPSSVEELRPTRPPAPDVARLDAALRARLLRTPLPPRLNVLGFAGGLVTLAVAHEFEADLTLGPYSEAAAATDCASPDQAADVPRLGGWALVRVRLCVCAASASVATQLAESHQRQLCWQLTQRMSGSAEPLHVLLAVLQEFCAFAARDIAVKQAKALAASRWAGAVRLSALPGTPSPGFAIQYWLPTPRANTARCWKRNASSPCGK